MIEIINTIKITKRDFTKYIIYKFGCWILNKPFKVMTIRKSLN